MAAGQVRTQDTQFITGTAANDPVIVSQMQAAINAAIDNKAFKFPVDVAVITGKNAGDLPFNSFAGGVITTTTNVSTIDGFNLAVGTRVLVNHLTGANAPYNGLYAVNSLSGTSQFTRAADASTTGTGNYTDLIVGSTVFVDNGSVNANTSWTLQPSALGNDALTLNTTAIKFLQPNGGTTYVPTLYAVVPSGTLNGTNMTFTLPVSPLNGTALIFLRGQLEPPGSSASYTLSGSTITFNNNASYLGPQAGDSLYAIYNA